MSRNQRDSNLFCLFIGFCLWVAVIMIVIYSDDIAKAQAGMKSHFSHAQVMP